MSNLIYRKLQRQRDKPKDINIKKDTELLLYKSLLSGLKLNDFVLDDKSFDNNEIIMLSKDEVISWLQTCFLLMNDNYKEGGMTYYNYYKNVIVTILNIYYSDGSYRIISEYEEGLYYSFESFLVPLIEELENNSASRFRKISNLIK